MEKEIRNIREKFEDNISFLTYDFCEKLHSGSITFLDEIFNEINEKLMIQYYQAGYEDCEKGIECDYSNCLKRYYDRNFLKETQSYVYFISDGSCVKIGKAINVNNRLHSLQTASPKKLEVIRIIKCKNEEESFLYEKNLHEHYKKLKTNDVVGNEWFNGTALRTIKIISEENLLKIAKGES